MAPRPALPKPRWKPRRPWTTWPSRGQRPYRHRSCHQTDRNLACEHGDAHQREFARMAQARETLGIRSEHRIQQEILRTQAAYQRLASSGTMTWREQQRAAEQMRQTVGRLNAEMGVFSGKQRLVAGAQKAGLMAAGVMAGAAVVAPKVSAFAYDEQLAHMANTAYGDPSLSAAEDRARRFAGRQEMHQPSGGGQVRWGTRESAAATLNSLLSAGQFGAKDSLTIFARQSVQPRLTKLRARILLKLPSLPRRTWASSLKTWRAYLEQQRTRAEWCL